MDGEAQPMDFVYVSENCVTSDDVNIDHKLTNMHSCSCDDKCGSLSCVCSNNSLRCWYDMDEKLVPHFSYTGKN